MRRDIQNALRQRRRFHERARAQQPGLFRAGSKDVDVAAQPGRQPFEFFQGSGAAQQFQAVKAVELLFDHGYARLLSDGATIGRHFSSGNRQSFMLDGS
mgnify:CR=1 FL=1